MRASVCVLLLAAAYVACLPEQKTSAATCVTEDFSELLKRAECVVEVNISSLKEEPTSSVGMPRTVATLKVLRCHKGNVEAGSVIECETFGGRNGNSVVVMPGQPKLIEGTTALLLLTKSNAGTWRAIAGEAGVVELYRDKTNTRVAQRAKGEFEFYVSDPQSLSGYAAVKSTSITAEQLGRLIEVVLATGRPVFEDSVAAVAPPTPAPKAPVAAPTASPNEHGFPFGNVLLVLGLTSLAWLAIRKRG